MSYVRMFRKMRRWSRWRVEMAHLLGAVKLRALHKRRYCRKAETGNQPKAAAMKATYEFLQRFHADMPDIAQRRRLSRDEQEQLDTVDSKADGALVGKPFHGGRTPDIATCSPLAPFETARAWMFIRKHEMANFAEVIRSMRWAPPAAKKYA